MNKRITSLLLLILILLGAGCGHGIKSQEPAKPAIEKVSIADYGSALFALDPFNVKPGLDSLSGRFSFFTGENPDTLNALQIRDFIRDPFNRSLYEEYRKIYPDLHLLEQDLGEMFGAVKSYYPGFKAPQVYTYISGLIYEAPVELVDSVLIIGIDMFLGWNVEQYRAAGLPVYMTRRMEPQYVVPECARRIAFSRLPGDLQPSTLLDHMILHGKVLMAMDKFLPGTADSLKIGYTTNQMKWCRENEALVWRLFIDQQLLYKTDAFVYNRFIQDGPFTSGLPEGAPAMLGKWIGWQIVRNYMKKNESTTLEELFDLKDSQQILTKSGYKPKK